MGKEVEVKNMWDDFIKSLPWSNLVVFGEGILKMFIPEWDEIKKQIIYFAAYAETVSKKGEKVTGDQKKEAVINFVWNSIKRLIPLWIPDFFVKGIIGNFIDLLINYLNTSVPGWEDKVIKLFPVNKK